MKPSQSIITERHPYHYHIILNAVATKNALNPEMINTLIQNLKDIEQSNNKLPILLSANGSDFCSGADLNWFRKSIHNDEITNYNEAKNLYELFNQLNQISNPTICCVQGHVFGGGLGLVSCCDYVLASSDTKFCFSEVKLGLVPATIMHFVINKIGISAARSLMISAKHFHAEYALNIQLIHEICPQEQLDKCLAELVQNIFHNGPEAMLATKQLLLNIANNSENHADNAISCLAKIRNQTEAQEGMQAFLDKRSPDWHSNDN